MKHEPQHTLNGTTTRSPTCRLVTALPTSSTIPIGSCPTTSPASMNGARVSYRWRSDPQRPVEVTLMIASEGSSICGSGTSVTAMLCVPCHVTARMLTAPLDSRTRYRVLPRPVRRHTWSASRGAFSLHSQDLLKWLFLEFAARRDAGDDSTTWGWRDESVQQQHVQARTDEGRCRRRGTRRDAGVGRRTGCDRRHAEPERGSGRGAAGVEARGGRPSRHRHRDHHWPERRGPLRCDVQVLTRLLASGRPADRPGRVHGRGAWTASRRQPEQ